MQYFYLFQLHFAAYSCRYKQYLYLCSQYVVMLICTQIDISLSIDLTALQSLKINEYVCLYGVLYFLDYCLTYTENRCVLWLRSDTSLFVMCYLPYFSPWLINCICRYMQLICWLLLIISVNRFSFLSAQFFVCVLFFRFSVFSFVFR